MPRKNTRIVAGRPLIAYTFDAAGSSRRLTRTILTTDSPEIADMARTAVVDVPFYRPPELAEDDTPTLPVIRHALEWLSTEESCTPDVVVLLQPTAPMRRADDIDEAIDLLISSGADSVVSVAPVPAHFNPQWQFEIKDFQLRLLSRDSLDNVIARRQSFRDTYARNGAIYAFWYRAITEMSSFYGKRCLPYIMPRERSVNIDDEVDLLTAEAMLSGFLAQNSEAHVIVSQDADVDERRLDRKTPAATYPQNSVGDAEGGAL